MPELPEVETIRQGLEKKIVGLTIEGVHTLNRNSFNFDSQKVIGQKVLNIWRRAKMLGVNLSGGKTLVFHLKMTGQLVYIDGKERLIGGHPTSDMRDVMPSKSTVLIFEFSDESKLFFNDQRRFGWIKLFKTQEVEANNFEKLGNLGPEPFSKEFTWLSLKEHLFKHLKTPVKVAIMNQSVIAGIGNIYASESLFLAKIDPRRLVKTLSDEELKKLHETVIESLALSLKYGGSTLSHYVNVEGNKGSYLTFANVYNREGQPCLGCKGVVVKISQAGRGTYFCPECQK